MAESRLEIEEAALKVIGNMEARISGIAQYYGYGSREHVEAADSLMRAFASLFRLGGKVMPDGELSLVSLSFMTYGCVFHPTYKNGTPAPLLGTWLIHS